MDPTIPLHSASDICTDQTYQLDDPDASTILQDLQETLSTAPFETIRDDIFALRAPADGTLIYW